MLDPHTTASHTFVIRNEGQDPLALEVQSTSCKCTTGNLSKGLLQPGESTDVTLEWNTGYESEHYAQTALLKTNDPLHQTIELTVKGTVRVELTAPQSVAFQKADVAEQTRASFLVFSQLWDEFTVADVSSDLQSFEWTAQPVSPDIVELADRHARSAWEITVYTTPLDYGDFAGKADIVVQPGDGSDPIHRSVECAGHVRSPINFYSPELHKTDGLDLGTLEAGKKYQFNIVTRARGDLDRQIEVLDVEPDALQASIKPMSTKGSYRLTLTVPEDCPMVMFNADQKHGYVQVGDPQDRNYQNWFPIYGALVKVD